MSVRADDPRAKQHPWYNLCEPPPIFAADVPRKRKRELEKADREARPRKASRQVSMAEAGPSQSRSEDEHNEDQELSDGEEEDAVGEEEDEGTVEKPVDEPGKTMDKAKEAAPAMIQPGDRQHDRETATQKASRRVRIAGVRVAHLAEDQEGGVDDDEPMEVDEVERGSKGQANAREATPRRTDQATAMEKAESKPTTGGTGKGKQVRRAGTKVRSKRLTSHDCLRH